MCYTVTLGKSSQAPQRKGLIEIMKNWKGKGTDKIYKNISSTIIRKKLKMNDHIEKISDLKKLLSKKIF